MVASGVPAPGRRGLGELDYLLVDMPPGTGDATLTLAQSIVLSGVVIVSQPQDVALGIAVKSPQGLPDPEGAHPGPAGEHELLRLRRLCKRHEVFSDGGARRKAEELGVPFLGEIPLAVDIREASDAGAPITTCTRTPPRRRPSGRWRRRWRRRSASPGSSAGRTIPCGRSRSGS